MNSPVIEMKVVTGMLHALGSLITPTSSALVDIGLLESPYIRSRRDGSPGGPVRLRPQRRPVADGGGAARTSREGRHPGPVGRFHAGRGGPPGRDDGDGGARDRP